MLFTEPRFIPFFLLVFAVHWALRGDRSRKVWLLLVSYAFYAAWDWRFLSLIAVSTLVDYVVGLRLVVPGARRRAWMGLSLAVNFGLLGFFKYYDFFVDSAMRVLEQVGLHPHLSTLHVILPVGISFYTFQTLSYSLDVYQGRLQPTRSLLDVATFVAFFPQLVAGPIVRASQFLPQLTERRFFSAVDVRAALVLFLVGFVKKACVSDNLAPVVDRYFADPGQFDAASAWIGVVAYTIQIYCDFSGYSDMAIACASLLGYRLMLNFDFPYFATSVADFWRRWHISLSTWLRDYLYIPLGGNRGTALFTFRNLMLTMLLGGLWHGAAWSFVLWGGLHGLALVVQRVYRQTVTAASRLRRVVGWISPLVTFWFVCLCWVFFRAERMQDAWTVLRGLVLFDSPGGESIGGQVALAFPVLAAAHWVAYRRWIAGWWRRPSDWGFAAAYAGMVALALPFVAVHFEPFIYFQF